jgi:hypothetical protein
MLYCLTASLWEDLLSAVNWARVLFRLITVDFLLELEIFGVYSCEVTHVKGVLDKFAGWVLVDEKNGGLFFACCCVGCS